MKHHIITIRTYATVSIFSQSRKVAKGFLYFLGVLASWREIKIVFAKVLTIILFLIDVIGFSQNNLLTLSGTYIVLNGGTSAANIYMVVDQNSALGIVRTSGHISSEGQYNVVKWNAGISTGNYVFPFGVGGNAVDYIPFTFNKTTAGSSDISMSTWTTNPQNVPHPAISNVPPVYYMTGVTDSVTSAIDRFWDIQSSSVTADLTFSYRGSENTTAVQTDTFKTQHWNGTAWDPQAGPGNPGVTTGIGTVGPIPGQTTFSPWVLTRAGFNAVITSFQNSACSSCTGTATAAPIGGASPYTYFWNNGQTMQTSTGLCAGTYTVTITDASNNTAMNTVTITQPAGPTAAVTATAITITLGGSAQLTATGGGTYSWSPSTGLSCTTCSNPIAAPPFGGQGGFTYCVLVTDANGCTDSACITIYAEIPCGELFVPNIFSPNNDGQNDLQCVLGNCIKTVSFAIYDRWGEKVFEYNGAPLPSGGVGPIGLLWRGGPCWDGMYKGRHMNTAVFVYKLDAVLSNDEQIIKKGNISLIR